MICLFIYCQVQVIIPGHTTELAETDEVSSFSYLHIIFSQPVWWKVSKLSIAVAISLLSIDGITCRNAIASLLLSHQAKQQILTTQRHLLYGVLCVIPAEVQHLSHKKMAWSADTCTLTGFDKMRFILINGPCLYKLKRANRGLWLYSEIQRRTNHSLSMLWQQCFYSNL